MIKFSAENIEACQPVNELLNMLISLGFECKESKVSDYHFNELYFLLKPKGDDIEVNTENIKIENIEILSDKKFCCKCHWSIVEFEN